MGAAAGHINHLYENLELSFNDIINIFQNITTGQLPVFEKFDGQNLMISYKDGFLVGARNKTQFREFTPISNIFKMFDKYPHVKQSFEHAISNLIICFKQIPKQTLQTIFCNGTKYLNLEIINKQSVNVINYDKSAIFFNSLCTIKDGNIVNQDVQSAINFYKNNIQIFQSKSIYPPQLINHEQFSDINLLEYKKLLRSNNIVNLNLPIGKLDINASVLKKIISKLGHELILNIPGSITDLKNTTEIKYRLINILNDLKNKEELLLKMSPHINIVQYCGGFNIMPNIEGIVFYINNLPHKITGIFAPINQILGFYKYSR